MTCSEFLAQLDDLIDDKVSVQCGLTWKSICTAVSTA